jgi:hypothetical protein
VYILLNGDTKNVVFMGNSSTTSAAAVATPPALPVKPRPPDDVRTARTSR